MSLDDRIHHAGQPITSSPTGNGSINSMQSKSSAVAPSPVNQHDVIVREVEAAGDERDVRHQQVFHGKYLFWLAYQSVGVIYGDIGTSPLYVYSSTFTENPTHDDLLGALSLIIWTLTLMVSIKYVTIVLRADDEGEGGTFAIYSLLSRYANIVRRDPREESTVKMERVKTSDLKYGKTTRSFLERSTIMKSLLKVVGVLGVSLVMSDGILTPAQSVLGAIQGLKIVDETISTPTIVGTSCAILVLLFLVQPLGVTKLGSSFAPIVIIWMIFNMSFGIYNLVHFDHSVLKAFSPYFAGAYLQRNKTDGWRSLGGILLAFTGVEALFADLGAFSRRAIQLSWLCFAFPCLLLAYIGQAAYLSRHNDAYSNPFFSSVPPGMFYPSLVVAILAAIVASQTMITATFQLLSQIIKLSYFPQIKVVHTSKVFHNQIYIPWVNWLLMIGTVCVTAAYNNTTKLGEAYGVCVILVTFITTCMVSLVALVVWQINIVFVLTGFIIFGLLDGLYLSSALTKVPDGAWFTVCLAVLLSIIFVLWRYGKENQWHAEASDRISTRHLLMLDPESSDEADSTDSTGLRLRTNKAPITKLKGVGIFYDKTGSPQSTPTVFVHFLQKFQAAPSVIVFFHLRPLSRPTVPLEERFSVTRCWAGNGWPDHFPNFFRVTIRHGYADQGMSENIGLSIYENIRSFIIREAASSTAPPLSAEVSDDEKQSNEGAKDVHMQDEQRHEAVRHNLAVLQAAYEKQVVHIVGKEQMRIDEVKQCRAWPRKLVLAAFLWLRSNTGSKVANMNLDIEKLVEVGFVKAI